MNENSSEPNFFREFEFHFACSGCGACCAGSPGYVLLSENDASALASHFGITIIDFAIKYCRLVDLGFDTVISLKENEDYSCIFLEKNLCSIYTARPLQCRTYPFWESIVASKETWTNEKRFCSGIDMGPRIPKSDIMEMLVETKNNTYKALAAKFLDVSEIAR